MTSLFWQSFEKQAAKQVATVAVLHDGHVLMGKRRDNNKWTTPGGHMNEGETPIDGAVRELKEETGIVAPKSALSQISTIDVKEKDLKVHGFVYRPSSKLKATADQDPDKEVFGWEWLKYNPFPKKLENAMHVPYSSNALWSKLGIRDEFSKTAAETLTGGLADGKPDSDFPKDQLAKGVKVEAEHTSDPKKAKEVAKDHLVEDKKYYDKLQTIEKKAFWSGFFKWAAEAKKPKYFHHTRHKSPHVKTLNRAIRSNAKGKESTVTLDYTKADGSKVTRKVTPYTSKNNVLVGHDHTRGEIRSFRLDRISGLS